MKRLSRILSLCALTLLLSACGGPSAPLEKIKTDLAGYPEYSIILEDMKEEGNFIYDFYHRYKIIYGEAGGTGDSLVYTSTVTDWLEVPVREYENYSNYLGMVIASKSRDGQVDNTATPPGYQYVGNPQYGRWRSDSNGNSFWEFYGKYALLSQLFGMFSRPVYRGDWDTYRNYHSSGRPYYGQNNQYGTSGTQTQKSNPTFFQRRQARDVQRRQSFADRVQKRTRRSNMSGFRSRSGGFGK